MYRLKSDGSIKSKAQIIALHPNKTIPKLWTTGVCDSLGIDPILATPKPTASTELKRIVSNGVEQDALGNWVEAWQEVDIFSDITDDEGNVTTKAEQEADYIATQLATNIEVTKGKLKADFLTYLIGKYDIGTQMTIQTVHASSTDPTVLANANLVGDWIKTVQEYYKAKKLLVKTGNLDTTWDFESFTETKPDLDWDDFIK